MLVSAPRRQPITHVLGLIVLFSGCHKKSDAPAPGNGRTAATVPSSWYSTVYSDGT